MVVFISPITFQTLGHVRAPGLPFYIISSLSGGTPSYAEKQRKVKVKKIESDGSCLLVAGGRGGGGGGVDGLISGSDYLLITIRREPLEEEENV